MTTSETILHAAVSTILSHSFDKGSCMFSELFRAGLSYVQIKNNHAESFSVNTNMNAEGKSCLHIM